MCLDRLNGVLAHQCTTPDWGSERSLNLDRTSMLIVCYFGTSRRHPVRYPNPLLLIVVEKPQRDGTGYHGTCSVIKVHSHSL